MNIKERLVAFPLSLIFFVIVLVSIISWNSYLTSYQNQTTIKHINISIALLREFKIENKADYNHLISNKLKQLKQLEKNNKRLTNFNQISSFFILIGSLLLCVIFFWNVNSFIKKLNLLNSEITRLSKRDVKNYDFDYPLISGSNNEIDSLAAMIKQVFGNFRILLREKNGMLQMMRVRNKQLQNKETQKSKEKNHEQAWDQ